METAAQTNNLTQVREGSTLHFAQGGGWLIFCHTEVGGGCWRHNPNCRQTPLVMTGVENILNPKHAMLHLLQLLCCSCPACMMPGQTAKRLQTHGEDCGDAVEILFHVAFAWALMDYIMLLYGCALLKTGVCGLCVSLCMCVCVLLLLLPLSGLAPLHRRHLALLCVESHTGLTLLSSFIGLSNLLIGLSSIATSLACKICCQHVTVL